MTRDKWVWMAHPAHFICGHDCHFTLSTYVGDFIVSTVGEYWPDRMVREIFAKSRGIEIEGRGDAWDTNYREKIGYEPIGWERTYETMVFKAKPAPAGLGAICCPWRIDSGTEVDFAGYNSPDDAREGHYALCEKWGAEGAKEKYDADRANKV